MISKHISLLVILLIVITGVSQNKKDILLTIDEQPVYSSEFKSVFNKNLDLVIDETQKNVDGYLNLFIDYKLKLTEAYAQGLDNGEKFKTEFSGYVDQLSKNYIYDKRVTSKLVKEAYERGLEEIDVNHILIILQLNANPQDSLVAYNKIKSLKEKVINGEDFEALARQYSEEPTANESAGGLGYFSVFQMLYDFETAAYNTKVGEISKITRTSFGYHILKINDRRLKRPKLNVSHIMIFSNKNAKVENPEERINELYALVMQGESFESVAKQYSEDRATAVKGGEIKTFGSGNLRAPLFEAAAYSIAEEGTILAPIESSFGWHIIRLNNKILPLSFEEQKSEIEKKVNSGARARIVTQAVNNKIKAKYGYQEGVSYLPYFANYVSDSVFKRKWIYKPIPMNQDKVLYTIGDRDITFNDFAQFIERKQKKSKRYKEKERLLLEFYNEFYNISLEDYFKFKLEMNNMEYSNSINEYRNGLLIFDAMEKNIWSVAKKDSIGLQKYYEDTKNDYMWKKRVDADIISTSNESIANETIRLFKEGKNSIEIKEQLNTEDKINVIVTSDIFEINRRELPENFEVKIGVSDLYSRENSKVLVNVKEILEPSVKELDEVKGIVMSNYQLFVEKEWMKMLHEKYTIVINKKSLKKIKKELNH